LADLSIPHPIANLEVGSSTHAIQTAKMMIGLDEYFSNSKPDAIIVYGDTNSTLAASLVAAKSHIYLAHVEAGLRSRNSKMPEEVNRILVDHTSNRLYAPTLTAIDNLSIEGLFERSVLTGDIAIETINISLRKASIAIEIPTETYYLATIHRAENLNDSRRLKSIISALGLVDEDVLLFAHPKLEASLNDIQISLPKNVRLCHPQNHSSILQFMARSKAVITDSGGIQKEAYILGKLCTTLRNESEWSETLAEGWNQLCCDLSLLGELVARNEPKTPRKSIFGDGNASQRIVEDILNEIS
jgi:UDP-N-acetylglucosamine 2-epimerase